MMRMELEEHERTCKYRSSTCTHCEKEMQFLQMNDHDAECPMVDVEECPNECGASMKREKMNHHVENDFKEAIVQ